MKGPYSLFSKEIDMNGLYKMKQMMFGLIFCSIAFDTDAIIPHECNGKVSNASVLHALEQGVVHAYERVLRTHAL